MYYRENDKVVESVEAYRMTNGTKNQSSMVLVILCSILAGLFILQVTLPKEWSENKNINIAVDYGTKIAIVLVLLLINNSQ